MKVSGREMPNQRERRARRVEKGTAAEEPAPQRKRLSVKNMAKIMCHKEGRDECIGFPVETSHHWSREDEMEGGEREMGDRKAERRRILKGGGRDSYVMLTLVDLCRNKAC